MTHRQTRIPSGPGFFKGYAPNSAMKVSHLNQRKSSVGVMFESAAQEDLCTSNFTSMSFQRVSLLCLSFLCLVLTSGCLQQPETRTKPTIICTTGMVADLVNQIVGSSAEVEYIIPAGLDPHTYKATPKNVAAIMDADVVVFSGIGLEAKMEEVLKNYGMQEGNVVFSLGEGLTNSSLIALEHGDEVDPHFWFDIDLWSAATSHTAERLAMAMPSEKDQFSQRATGYIEALSELKEWSKGELSKIPENQRVLVTVHDAFSYFGRSFDVEVKGLLGVSPEVDAGVQDVSALVQFLVERKIPAVFVEESLPTRTMQAVVNGCASYEHEVRMGESLFADNVGADETPQSTYVGMVEYNINTIVNALK